MSQQKIILLTGFEPFGGSSVNPSIKACKLLINEIYNGHTVKVEEIPVKFKEIKPKIIKHIDSYNPSAVICTGQSSRPVISLERVAINIANARIPYNCGLKPIDEKLEQDSPAGFFTKLPLRKLLESLTEAKIPAEVSNTAGTFGCNQVFYHLLKYLEDNRINIPAGFVHVPLLPEQVVGSNKSSMSLEVIAEALRIILKTVSDNL
jgi:pyroglutamyl-peptidase